MKRHADTLLPSGEKGRDEGMSHPNEEWARRRGVVALSCTQATKTRRLRVLRPHPLTPFPLSRRERGG
jgi:hypothetical protein